jgi:hypothetical protein
MAVVQVDAQHLVVAEPGLKALTEHAQLVGLPVGSAKKIESLEGEGLDG